MKLDDYTVEELKDIRDTLQRHLNELGDFVKDFKTPDTEGVLKNLIAKTELILKSKAFEFSLELRVIVENIEYWQIIVRGHNSEELRLLGGKVYNGMNELRITRWGIETIWSIGSAEEKRSR